MLGWLWGDGTSTESKAAKSSSGNCSGSSGGGSSGSSRSGRGSGSGIIVESGEPARTVSQGDKTSVQRDDSYEFLDVYFERL